MIKTIEQINIKEKRVIVRVDFNVPRDINMKITDDIRIRSALETINYCIKNRSKIIILAHFGRPNGKRVPELSLKPIAEYLSTLINQEVKFFPDIDHNLKEQTDKLQAGEVAMLENTRYYPEETENDPEFSKILGSLGDVYINDAFSMAHREHSSTVGIINYIKTSCAGFELLKEVNYINKAIELPERPVAAIIGGAKISGKLDAILNILNKVDTIMIGGGMSFTFLKAMGYNVGKSLVEDNLLDTAKEIMYQANSKGVELLLPIDVVEALDFKNNTEFHIVDINNIHERYMGLDIGPKTTKLYREKVASMKTIVWNGPMGVFEMPNFAHGTNAIAQEIADSDCLSIVGGGDSVAAINQAGLADKVSYISTGGGTFLQLLEGRELQAVAALERKPKPREKLKINTFKTGGHFGKFGGRYVPEMLIGPLADIEKAYIQAKNDKSFIKEFEYHLKTFSGRPTPLYFAENLTKKLNGAKIYLKQEGLGQTGSHKINNAIGQALLAKRMGKKKLIAETGAGQHGFATATVAAKFGFECEIFMGQKDILRQRPNVFWMEQLGAKVTPVTTGSQTLKDAVNESIRNWIEDIDNSHLLVGSALSSHPYPTMVRDFQSYIGKDVKKQMHEEEGKLPDYLVACVGGGSNAIGLFYPFLNDLSVKMVGVEAGGTGIEKGTHAARFSGGKEGIIEGYRSIFLQDEDGQTEKTSSIAAGLDYPGIGPEHAYLQSIGRAEYTYATDDEVINALKTLIQTEGIIPALESSHAIAKGLEIAQNLSKDKTVVINISGRGDKDIFQIAEVLGDDKWIDFLKSKVEAAENAK